MLLGLEQDFVQSIDVDLERRFASLGRRRCIGIGAASAFRETKPHRERDTERGQRGEWTHTNTQMREASVLLL